MTTHVHAHKIHWLAGLLEGEGYFGVRRDSRNNGKSFVIVMNSTDCDIVENASRIMLGYKRMSKQKNSKYYYSNAKDSYSVCISGSLAIQWMMTLYSLMGERRKERIKDIVSQWKVYHGKK